MKDSFETNTGPSKYVDVQELRTIYRDRRLINGSIATFAILLDESNRDGLIAISFEDIAKKLHVSEKTIARHIKLFVVHGYLEMIKNKNQDPKLKEYRIKNIENMLIYVS